jgi:ribose 5-phosphate isomerase B
MTIYLGSDHNGFHLKEQLFAYLSKRGYVVSDVGDKELDKDDDFPQFAAAACIKVLGDADEDARAILLCGGGQGMCMAANRFHGIRASVVWDEYEAKMTRNDNDSNVLCLPSRLLDDQTQWQSIVDTWLMTPFAGAERFRRRNRQLDELA